jgi:hypothetical protein
MTPNVCSTKPRRWNLPLTYEPKIEAVKVGTCTQTIRVIGKAGPKRVGDLISLHGYVNGRGTPWTWRTPYMEIVVSDPIRVFNEGIRFDASWSNRTLIHPWNILGWIAREDGIVPPTGEALRDVLISKNGKIPPDGIEAQIIRWNPEAAHD